MANRSLNAQLMSKVNKLVAAKILVDSRRKKLSEAEMALSSAMADLPLAEGIYTHDGHIFTIDSDGYCTKIQKGAPLEPMPF